MRNKTGNIGFYVYDAFYHRTKGTFSFVPEIVDKTNLPFGKPNHFLGVSSRIPLNYNTLYEQLFVEQRSTANYYTPYKFSGKEKDEETSYSYFGTRYYLSDISVWASVDPLAEKYPYQSPYTYCGWNPINLIDPRGMDEFEINKETGKTSKVNENKHYINTEGGKIIVKAGEEYKGDADLTKMKQVDQVSNSKGEKIDVTAGILGQKQNNEDSYQVFTFGSFSEAENFYYFSAESSAAEWAMGEFKFGGGVVGTNYSPNSNFVSGVFEDTHGESLSLLSHSHPGAGGPPSYNLRTKNNKLTGDLNTAAISKLDIKREAFDVPNRTIYSYTLNPQGFFLDNFLA